MLILQAEGEPLTDDRTIYPRPLKFTRYNHIQFSWMPSKEKNDELDTHGYARRTEEMLNIFFAKRMMIKSSRCYITHCPAGDERNI